MKDMLLKSIQGAVKDVDKTKRVVTGYFSTFTSDPDSDGDIMDYKAFDQTLSMNGPGAANRIWHLFNHSAGSPINKPYLLQVDTKGLYFETKFPDTKLANDTLVLYQEGAITEHSIGFNIIQARNEGNYQLIQEVRLWEGSSVLWGANQYTPTTGIKAEQYELQAKLLDTLLHNGNLSDEMFTQIEQLLTDLKNIFRPEQQPPDKQEETDIIHSYYKQLNERLTLKLN